MQGVKDRVDALDTALNEAKSNVDTYKVAYEEIIDNRRKVTSQINTLLQVWLFALYSTSAAYTGLLEKACMDRSGRESLYWALSNRHLSRAGRIGGKEAV